MGGLRACAVILLLVQIQVIVGKPLLGSLWCDWFCDDYDDDDLTTTTTTTTLDDLLDALFDPCSDCPTRRPTTPRIPTTPPGFPGGQQPFNIMMMPPTTGMNLTMTNTGTSWFMNFMPWGGGAVTPAPMTPTAGSTAAPPPVTTTPAGNATNATAA